MKKTWLWFLLTFCLIATVLFSSCGEEKGEKVGQAAARAEIEVETDEVKETEKPAQQEETSISTVITAEEFMKNLKRYDVETILRISGIPTGLQYDAGVMISHFDTEYGHIRMVFPVTGDPNLGRLYEAEEIVVEGKINRTREESGEKFVEMKGCKIIKEE
jgi:hypothetical protein